VQIVQIFASKKSPLKAVVPRGLRNLGGSSFQPSEAENVVPEHMWSRGQKRWDDGYPITTLILGGGFWEKRC